MKHTELGLQGLGAQGRGTIVAKDHEVVLSLHPGHDGGLGQHRLDAEWSRARVLEAFSRFEDWLPAGYARSLHDILVRATDGLDLEPA